MKLPSTVIQEVQKYRVYKMYIVVGGDEKWVVMFGPIKVNSAFNTTDCGSRFTLSDQP